MGLLDDYQIDMDEIEEPSFDIEDDIYPFVVGNAWIQEGTTNKPDNTWIVIEYLLGDEGKKKSEWFLLPLDSVNPTEAEKQKLGFLKTRVKNLLPNHSGSINDVELEDLVGISGTLQVFSQKGKGTNAGTTYQNIKNVRVEEEESESAEDGPGNPAQTFVGEDETPEAMDSRIKAQRAARTAPAAKAPAKAPAKATTAVKNPFAK